MVQVRLRQKDKSIPFFDYKTRYYLNIGHFALFFTNSLQILVQNAYQWYDGIRIIIQIDDICYFDYLKVLKLL